MKNNPKLNLSDRKPISHILTNLKHLKTGDRITIAGRLVQIDADSGYTLCTIQDQSGEIIVEYQQNRKLTLGDLILAAITKEDNNNNNNKENSNDKEDKKFSLTELQVIQKCQLKDLDNNKIFNRYWKDKNQRNKLIYRQQIIGSIRKFFTQNEFLEVETPLLVKSPGLEPHLNAFKTTYYDLQGKPTDYYLPTSPEFAMKNLLAAGFEKIFQISKCFRNNGELSLHHQPEFTMIEWYRAYEDYNQIMDDVEKLFDYLAKNLSFLSPQIKTLLRQENWHRMSVHQAFIEYADIDLDKCTSRDDFLKYSHQFQSRITDNDQWDDIFFKIFLDKIEPHLGVEKPTILYDYPYRMAALSTIHPDNPLYCQRFEVYIKSMELGNAFNELTCPITQENRFKQFSQEKQRMKKEIYPIDSEFMDSLRLGIPPSAGIAMGVDRIVALLIGSNKIEDVLILPK